MAKETTATTKMGKLDSHLSSLWVLAALFVAVFVTICIYVYAGKQSDLPAREFPDTTVKGSLTVDSSITGNYMNYITGDNFGLTVDTMTDAEVIAGHAAIANTIAYSDWDAGDNGGVTLPAANAGTVFIYQQGEEADGGNFALTFTSAGTDTFEAGNTINLGTANANQSDTSVATDVSLAITFVGTDDVWGGVGSQICFYCTTGGKWRVRLGRVTPTGTGAPGTQVSFA